MRLPDRAARPRGMAESFLAPPPRTGREAVRIVGDELVRVSRDAARVIRWGRGAPPGLSSGSLSTPPSFLSPLQDATRINPSHRFPSQTEAPIVAPAPVGRPVCLAVSRGFMLPIPALHGMALVRVLQRDMSGDERGNGGGEGGRGQC